MKDIKNNFFVILLVGLGLGGFLATWICTPWGVRAGYDSLFYISAAQNLVNGLGLSRLMAEGTVIPLTHFPPLYSLVVAGFSFLVKGDILLSARWTAVLVFGINIVLFGFLCYRYSRSKLAGILGAIFCLFSPILLNVNISAFSEGLYIALLLPAIFFINESLTYLNWRYLFLAAVFSALCCLTRYVGITVILTGLLAILFLSRLSLKKKIGAASLYGFVSSLPIAVWYFRNWILTGSMTNRVFSVHLPGKADLYQALNTVTSWIFPETLSFWIRLGGWVVVFVFVGLVAFGWGRSLMKSGRLLEEPSIRLVLLLIIHEGVYLFSLLVSRSFFDSSTQWEQRILSPLYIISALLTLTVLWNGLHLEHYNWRRIILVALLLLLFISYLPMSIDFLNKSYTEGLGFTGLAWRNSQTMQILKRFPPGSIFYSNNTTAIYFVLGKPANGIPERYDSVKAQARSDYKENLTRMRQQLQQSNCALVIFNPYRNVPEYPPLDELTDGLVVYEKTKDGTVYVTPNKNP